MEDVAHMQGFSQAADLRLQGVTHSHAHNVHGLQRSHRISDAKMSEIFNQERAYLIENVHEAGYTNQVETLRDASEEQVEEWKHAKQELVKKDAMLDHASQKIHLSYKGLVVDHKLG